MSSKRRDKSRDLQQRQSLWDHYGGRIVRTGRLAPLVDYTRFYCFDCENHFLQRTKSLAFDGATPRCKCPPNDSKRFTKGSNMKSRGNMCLPEWEQSDLEKPDRPTCRPDE